MRLRRGSEKARVMLSADMSHAGISLLRAAKIMYFLFKLPHVRLSISLHAVLIELCCSSGKLLFNHINSEGHKVCKIEPLFYCSTNCELFDQYRYLNTKLQRSHRDVKSISRRFSSARAALIQVFSLHWKLNLTKTKTRCAKT